MVIIDIHKVYKYCMVQAHRRIFLRVRSFCYITLYGQVERISPLRLYKIPSAASMQKVGAYFRLCLGN